MGRPSKPWFWKRRKAWFVTIDGARHFLAVDQEDTLIRFHQLMAEPQKRVVRADSLAVVIDLFLEPSQKHRAARNYEWYRFRLERFVQRYPELRTHCLGSGFKWNHAAKPSQVGGNVKLRKTFSLRSRLN